MAGYHIKTIQRGIPGEISKIREELEELEDAATQDIKVMELCEVSDLIQAIRLYLQKHHTGYTLYDMIKMADATERAFNDGTRVAGK